MITYHHGDILDDPSDAIVNAVNTVGVMGKGLALQFKNNYPENFDEYKRACDNKVLVVGQMLTVELFGTNCPDYIINFPTKAHWRNPSKFEYIKQGLEGLKQEVKRLGLNSVALPALGCGLGGLSWMEVQYLIEESLSELPDVDWQVYLHSRHYKLRRH